MRDTVLAAVLVTVSVWSLRPVGGSDTEVVRIKPTAAVTASVALAAEGRGSGDQSASAASNNGTSPCDRHLRSAEVEVRNPRNHKFVTSNGWADRQRPRPEINVYPRVEEQPSPQTPLSTAAATAAYYQQQRESYYQQHSSHPQNQQQPPSVRTSKRIIYYATLPDVVRPPPQQSGHPTADPYALGPGPFSADFRQLDRNVPPDSLPRNRLAPYENAYNRGVGGAVGGGGAVTSVTSKSTALYNSRYDEPAEFREQFYRPNEFTSSKFASWAEPFYKSWTSSSWDRESPSYGAINRGGGSPFPWDRELPPSRWDNRGSSWDSARGSPWDNGGSSWDNRGSSWDKDLVEVPLQKPGGGGDGLIPNSRENNFDPEVAVVQSGVIDVRGDRQQLVPPPRFTIVDVDPKPRPQQQQPPNIRSEERNKPPPPTIRDNDVRYDSPQRQKPMRHEEYVPMQPPKRYMDQQQQPPVRYMDQQQQLPVRYMDQQQQPPVRYMDQQQRPPMRYMDKQQPPTRYMDQQQQPPPPQSMQYEQQYQPPQSPQSSSSTRYGQNQPEAYYETIKNNNVNTQQFMTSWTEISEHDEVTPTHSVSIEINSLGNSTSKQNNTRITPNTITNTKLPK